MLITKPAIGLKCVSSVTNFVLSVFQRSILILSPSRTGGEGVWAADCQINSGICFGRWVGERKLRAG